MGKLIFEKELATYPMADTLTILIDLTEADASLEPEELETRSLNLADELLSGDLVNTAHLAREVDLPEGAKSGLLAFVGGVLTAEVNSENLKKALVFLGNRFYGKTLTLEYEADGLKTTLEYKNEKDLDVALAAVQKLENMRIQLKEKS